MTNPYITAKRSQYDAIRMSIEGLQSRAVDEKRDLTEDELKSITSQGEQARAIADEVTALVEIEHRNAAVAATAVEVTQDRATGNAAVQHRDPGHYRSEVDGGTGSFFADLIRSKEGDDEAKVRLSEHHRALSSTSSGTGILPPKWLTDEYLTIARQTRRVADAVRHISLGTDPRPITLPKQTVATSVVQQSAENATTVFTDSFNTGVDTVTPVTLVGGQEVSRQLIDASTPAIDQLIYSDLMTDYNTKVEKYVVGMMITAAGAPQVTYATEAAYATALVASATTPFRIPFLTDLRKTITSVRNLRKLPPDVVVTSISRYGSWLDMTDNQGRPVVPVSQYGTVNVYGQGTAMTDGSLLGLNIMATDGIVSQGAYPESILVARAADTILFESAMTRFRYEEPKGPETIRLGVWGYVGAITRYAGTSVQRLQITGA